MRLILSSIFIVASLTTTSAATLENSRSTDQRPDYSASLLRFHSLSVQGDANAQLNLGVIYTVGQGVPQDYEEAVNWYRKAANQGNAASQRLLGIMYYNGYGVPRDYVQAVAWFRRAAAQGDANAKGLLGAMYWQGQGVPMDHQEAVTWTRRAATQGLAAAQYCLGSFYANPDAPFVDMREDDGFVDLTDAKVHSVPQNYSEAVRWFRKAADQGLAQAQTALGFMYLQGHGVPQDYREAAIWIRKAADRDNAGGQAALGLMYELGVGVPQDHGLAYLWSNLAAVKASGEPLRALLEFRDSVAKEMNTTEIAEAQRRAREWKPKPESISVLVR